MTTVSPAVRRREIDDALRARLAEILRGSQGVIRSALAADLGVQHDRSFRLAFQAARRDLEADGIFFAPAGDGRWERCSERTALLQSERGTRASRRRLLREATKAGAVARQADDPALRIAAGRHAVRTENMTAVLGEIARKRKFD